MSNVRTIGITATAAPYVIQSGAITNLTSANGLNDTMLEAIPTSYVPPGSSNLARGLAAWSTSVLYGDKAYWTGGGHDDWYWNGVLVQDLNTGVWSRLREASPNLVQGNLDPSYLVNGPYGLYSDGSPIAQHNYDILQIAPATATYPAGQIIMATRSGFIGETSATKSFAYALDLANPSAGWRRSTNAVDMGDGYGSATYIPSLGKILRVGIRNDDSYFVLLDPDTMTHGAKTLFTDSAFNGIAYDIVGGLWPTLDYVMYRITYNGLNQLRLLDPVALTRTLVTTSGTGPSATQQTGIEWCEPKGKFYLYEWGATSVWTLTPPATNPKTNAWTWGQESMAGTAPFVDTTRQSKTTNQRNNFFRWWDNGNAFHFVGRVDQPAQLYRPAGL